MDRDERRRNHRRNYIAQLSVTRRQSRRLEKFRGRISYFSARLVIARLLHRQMNFRRGRHFREWNTETDVPLQRRFALATCRTRSLNAERAVRFVAPRSRHFDEIR